MDFFYYFKSRQGEMIRLLKDIVGHESPSGEKKAVDACSAYVIDELKKNRCQNNSLSPERVGCISSCRVSFF